MTDKKIGIIGLGNMGSALLNGVINSNTIPVDNIIIYDLDQSKRAIYNELKFSENSCELTVNADIIILAVEPHIISKVLTEIKSSLSNEKIIISLAAGISHQSMYDLIDGVCPVVRTMPNSPMLVGEGMTAICDNHGLNDDDINTIKALMSSAGLVVILEENLMDAFTALAGSSPAYLFVFIEAMADGGVLMGMPRDKAYKIAAQAMIGSAKLMIESGKHPGELKDMITSPAGTTIEALHVLEKGGFRGLVMDCIKACAEKNKKIGKLNG